MAAKDLYEKDLYLILGVKKSDDPAAIKKQYRKMVKELHPDKTKGDKKLEDRFKEVSEAYEVLSDDKKRAEYNEMRDAYKSGRIPQGGNQQGNAQDFGGMFGGGMNEDIFSTLFGGGRRAPQRGGDLQTQTTISFRDSLTGSEIDLRLEGQTVTTRIPAGIKNGAKIKLKGRGQQGQGGPGDLLVIVNVAPHPIFTRDEDQLVMTLPVTFTEAALGADIKVPTIDGDEVTVRIGAGTPNGKKLRVKGRGVTRNHHTGDLMINIEVIIPQRVDGKAKKALEEFAEATKEYDPRKDLNQRARA